MDPTPEITSFLSSRRARLSPEEAGVPRYGGVRRVPGLRREEVAHLAGISTDYYARLERGGLTGASREVLEAVARALRLDDDERQHLFDLAQVTRRRSPRGSRPVRTTVRPGIQRVLDAIDIPALYRTPAWSVSGSIGSAAYCTRCPPTVPGTGTTMRHGCFSAPRRRASTATSTSPSTMRSRSCVTQPPKPP